MTICSNCEGTGECPMCFGAGIDDEEPCGCCFGSGECPECDGSGETFDDDHRYD